MKRTISLVAAAIILVLLVAALFVYKKFIAGPGVPKGLATYYVEIPTNSSFEEVLGILREDGFVKDEGIFRMLSERMGYKRSPMRAGRFELKPGWNTIEMIRQLRSGEQAPVKLVLTNERLIENVAAKAARFIEPDSLQIWSLFQNEAYLDSIGYTSETLMSLFIPNTYEFYWNSSPRSFMSRMIREHDATSTRLKQLLQVAEHSMI